MIAAIERNHSAGARRFRWALVLALTMSSMALVGLPGCLNDSASEHEDVGQVGVAGIALTVAPGIVIATADYSVVGQHGAKKTGSINVGNSATLSTTIGGLLSAIGIAGMDRMIQANVIATSGRAVEAAGDVDVLLLDKTGTITLGNRQATAFLPALGVKEQELAPARIVHR